MFFRSDHSQGLGFKLEDLATMLLPFVATAAALVV